MLIKRAQLPRGSAVVAALLLLLFPGVNYCQSGTLAPPKALKDVYPDVSRAEEDIDAALVRARKQHKRVLIIFGGNWCYDCHVLDRALHEETAGQIVRASFLLVHVNIGEGNENLDVTEKYHVPIEKGVPAVAILKADGSILYSSGNGEFEAARSMMRKDLVTFLRRNRGKEVRAKR